MEMKSKIARILRERDSFEILTHVQPDEDAVGSTRALGLALQAMGKAVDIVYPDPVPRSLDFTEAPIRADGTNPAVSIVVDLSDPVMLGGVNPRGEVIVIDHHRGEGLFGAFRWIDPTRSSSAEMVYELLCTLETDITPAIATNLYMGLFGDTGGFMHANTTKEVFGIAHDLVSKGADPHAVAYRIKKTRALAFYKLLCAAVNRLVIRDRVLASYVTHEEITRFGARAEDTSGIVEEMASLDGVDLVIFLKEVSRGTIKASLRSRVKDAALNTAAAFGGGGHGLAAGCTLSGTPEAVVVEMIEEGVKWVRTA
ncbi:MAG TPA: bifunctional oligoribonuclease/PAP phosphatase NrnA [Deltaproteobacteria bacterium]|nr:bifunctional oligoribonuclease/PAP phosphatase NrnA [Deltaproteobacteria bacterium]